MKRIDFEKIKLIQLEQKEMQMIDGGAPLAPWVKLFGPIGGAIGLMSGLTTLYEWGYQYAKRKLDQ